MKCEFHGKPYKTKPFAVPEGYCKRHGEFIIFSIKSRDISSWNPSTLPLPTKCALRGSDTHLIIPSQDLAGTRDRGPPLRGYVTSKMDITCMSKRTGGILDPINQNVFPIECWET